ncbi:hypothetical protein Q8G35_18880 [Peribacillus simplex]|uniref:Uncharacterized protein n=2 Tax=Peribacillus TaxID=2675229 RepID=A0AA90P504_9BACI|nr:MULTISPECIES: hypothetical protein [Peribacillus]MDP1420391.1 hypothetical protein [Peribacillus simplex]MDP1453472.1 hypothetical protein [Peribacillus frigoritolerans]
MVKGTIKKMFVAILILGISYGLVMPNEASATSSQRVNETTHVKKKVKKYTEWSSYKRVSQNLNTKGAKGGSISSDRTVTFSPTVSGSIKGLGISLGFSKSSAKHYSLDVGPNRRVYMGYRVKYAVEKGENHTINIYNGDTITKKKYKVKKVKHGEYGLVNY